MNTSLILPIIYSFYTYVFTKIKPFVIFVICIWIFYYSGIDLFTRSGQSAISIILSILITFRLCKKPDEFNDIGLTIILSVATFLFFMHLLLL